MSVKKTIVILFSIFYFLFSGAAAPVLAQGISGAERLRQGLGQAAGTQGANIQYRGELAPLIGTVIGSVLTLIGILFFLLSVYGGFMWMTARGNEERITKGKNTIIAAAIGVIIVIGSYAVTNLVLQSTKKSSELPLPVTDVCPTAGSDVFCAGQYPSATCGSASLQGECIPQGSPVSGCRCIPSNPDILGS